MLLAPSGGLFFRVALQRQKENSGNLSVYGKKACRLLGVDPTIVGVDPTIGGGEGMKRVVGSVMDTGEVMDGAVLGMFFPKRQNGFKEGWIAMAQNALVALAQADLGDQARRVLFVILGKLDFENYILISQSEISETLSMHRSDVSKAISKLETEGVLIRGPKAGRSSTFRLNPSFGWKGSASNHKKALKERMQASNIRGIVEPSRDPNTVDFMTGRTDAEEPGGQPGG